MREVRAARDNNRTLSQVFDETLALQRKSETAMGGDMKFKIGDRVVAYDCYSKLKGKIVGIEDSLLDVEHDVGGKSKISFFHPKQCRKLKPKKRRELWVKFDHIKWFQTNYPDVDLIRINTPPSEEGWIKVSEVKK